MKTINDLFDYGYRFLFMLIEGASRIIEFITTDIGDIAEVVLGEHQYTWITLIMNKILTETPIADMTLLELMFGGMIMFYLLNTIIKYFNPIA